MQISSTHRNDQSRPRIKLTKNTKAFTIVEMIIVIVVIGILASITIVAYRGVQTRAEVAAIASELTTLKKSFMVMMSSSGATQWPEDSPTGTNPTLEAFIAANPSYAEHIKVTPRNKDWLYDNDYSEALREGECSNPSDGTIRHWYGANIVIPSLPKNVALELDKTIDGKVDGECGQIRYITPEGHIIYKMSVNREY